MSEPRRKKRKNEFIDDEAELSGDDEVSEDEIENSDDDGLDLDLVDQNAPELDSDQAEEVRAIYHKQIESEDRRAVLMMQEHLEDKDVSIGQRRRRKFRWQTKELMENSLRRHYDPDDDDSQEVGDEDEDSDDLDCVEVQPRLRRPTAESVILSTTSRISSKAADQPGPSSSRSMIGGFSDDSNSNIMNSRSTSNLRLAGATASDLSRFIYRDKEVVEALSIRETVIASREEKDRNIQRELKRVLQSESIFDQLYG